jgi:hypothetical protein
MISEASVICWMFLAVEVLGLASACGVRLSAGSRRQGSCQCLFLGCLALMGGAALVSPAFGPRCWLISSVTLALMILTVTCDFSRSLQDTAC